MDCRTHSLHSRDQSSIGVVSSHLADDLATTVAQKFRRMFPDRIRTHLISGLLGALPSRWIAGLTHSLHSRDQSRGVTVGESESILGN
jgi:hypothetical protein